MAHVTPTWSLVAYRFRNDDGSETAATWKANQNTTISQVQNAKFRLRIEVQETAGGAANNNAMPLQFSHNGGAWTEIGTATSPVALATSSNFADGDPTTNQLTSGTGTFVSGGIWDLTSGPTAVSFAGNDHTEIEWCLIISGATTSDTIQFRTLMAGATYTYTVTPSLTVAAPPVPTAAPTLTVGAVSGTTAVMSCTTVANADTYEFQRNTVTQQDTASTSFSDSGLTPGSSYTYRVRGSNTSGDGPWSNEVTVTAITTARIGLSNPASSVDTGTRTVRVRSQVSSGSGSLTTSLYESGVLVEEWTDSLTSSWATFSHAVTQPITDYTALEFRFTGTVNDGAELRISWTEFGVPEGAAAGQQVVANFLSSPGVFHNPTVNVGPVSLVTNKAIVASNVYNPTIVVGVRVAVANYLATPLTIQNPQVSPGPVDVVTNKATISTSIHEPAINAIALPSVELSAVELFITFSVNTGQAVVANKAVLVAVLHQPAVAVGAVAVVANYFDAGATFYEPTITTGPVAVVAEKALITPTVNEPSVAVGAVTIQALLLSAGEIWAPEVEQRQTADYLAIVASVFTPAAATQTYVVAERLTVLPQVFEPDVAVAVAVPLLTVPAAFFEPSATTSVTLQTQYVAISASVNNPAVAAGAVTVAVQKAVIATAVRSPGIFGFAVIRPDGDLDTSDWVGTWEDIDDPILSPNDSDWVQTVTFPSDAVFSLTDMPSGFTQMQSVKILMRVRGQSLSTRPVFAQILDAADQPLTNEVQVVEIDSGYSVFTDVMADFTGVVAANIVTWNGAKVRLRV